MVQEGGGLFYFFLGWGGGWGMGWDLIYSQSYGISHPQSNCSRHTKQGFKTQPKTRTWPRTSWAEANSPVSYLMNVSYLFHPHSVVSTLVLQVGKKMQIIGNGERVWKWDTGFRDEMDGEKGREGLEMRWIVGNGERVMAVGFTRGVGSLEMRHRRFENKMQRGLKDKKNINNNSSKSDTVWHAQVNLASNSTRLGSGQVRVYIFQPWYIEMTFKLNVEHPPLTIKGTKLKCSNRMRPKLESLGAHW